VEEAGLTSERGCAVRPSAGTVVGSRTGVQLGHTPAGSRQPVRFNLREGSDSNRDTSILRVGALGAGKTTLDQKLMTFFRVPGEPRPTGGPPDAVQAAAQAGVRKIVQLSALGAEAGAKSRYQRTKAAADARLAELGVPYVVLRPSVVYGPGDHSMTYFLSLAALPVTPVPGDGQYRLQPVHVDDVVVSKTYIGS